MVKIKQNNTPLGRRLKELTDMELNAAFLEIWNCHYKSGVLPKNGKFEEFVKEFCGRTTNDPRDPSVKAVRCAILMEIGRRHYNNIC